MLLSDGTTCLKIMLQINYNKGHYVSIKKPLGTDATDAMEGQTDFSWKYGYKFCCCTAGVHYSCTKCTGCAIYIQLDPLLSHLSLKQGGDPQKIKTKIEFHAFRVQLHVYVPGLDDYKCHQVQKGVKISLESLYTGCKHLK